MWGVLGRASPIFSFELPAADSFPSPSRGSGSGPRRLAPGGVVAPPSARKRARAQAMCCASILESGDMRFDDILECQIGDAVVPPSIMMIDRLPVILDSETDTTLACQTSVLTAAAATDGGGIHACIEGNILGLELLTALPPYTLWAFALRLRADCSRQEIRRGAAEFAARPEDILALAAPLYEIEMPVHCLPIYWQWQHERLHALSDLREPVPRSVFSRPDLPCPRLLGHHVGRVRVAQLPARSRDGAAPRRLHGGEAVTEVLRLRSVAATRQYTA